MSDNLLRNIAIFASGAGSNAQKIISYFKDSEKANIALMVCNNPNAGVLKIANAAHIPVLIIEKEVFRTTGYLQDLQNRRIDFIVLAGFLWKIPGDLHNR